MSVRMWQNIFNSQLVSTKQKREGVLLIYTRLCCAGSYDLGSHPQPPTTRGVQHWLSFCRTEGHVYNVSCSQDMLTVKSYDWWWVIQNESCDNERSRPDIRLMQYALPVDNINSDPQKFTINSQKYKFVYFS